MALMIAIDAGTTGVRALVLNAEARVIDVAYRELRQSYPSPGLVEHDAEEIWRLVTETLGEVASRLDPGQVASIGITNQRETVVAFDKATGRATAPALVWQDKRTAATCAQLRDQGHLDLVRSTTGLVLDPYFSATKMAWLLEHGALDGATEPALATVDAWIAWQLTGGVDGGKLVTDPSNASRTLLFDIDALAWSPTLSSIFGVPLELLPDVVPSCGRIATVAPSVLPSLGGVPLSGILGDQQAALFGQACFDEGMIKATYGTGAFVLLQNGPRRPAVADGLLTTVAWDLGDHGGVAYALEGSAFVAGAAIQWLRDELGIITDAAQTEALARQAAPGDGLSFVPAFVGLGSPWWDDSARGALVGITRGSGRAALARAVVDSLAFEVRAITDAMAAASSASLRGLRADGGAAAMDLLLQGQADQSAIPVERPRSLESTAIGAATVAGLAEGVYGSLDEVAETWSSAAVFEPSKDPADAGLAYDVWLGAVERSRGWA